MALTPALMRFDWGSTQGIPELLGFEPDGGPYAEAWWGAHPLAPSGTQQGTLDTVIAADAEAALGHEVAARFGTLPYLLKVLAIARPLSIQVHPSNEQARRGFDAEEAGGIELHDPHRTFKDASHKPEMLVAVSRLTVLSGFRPVADLQADLESLGGADALVLLGALREGGVAAYVAAALGDRHDNALAVLIAKGSRQSATAAIAAEAAAAHDGDRGALVALAMNAVTLEPGQALYTPSGVVHCYVSGIGVEIMANSDNVVRAGLTTKPVNADLLRELAVLEPTTPVVPQEFVSGGGRHLSTDAEEFELTVVQGGTAEAPAGPRIVLAIDGEVSVSVGGEVGTMSQGQASFITASEGAASVTATGLAVVASVRGPRR